MTTLDNFHTGNTRARQGYPSLTDRNNWVQLGVQSSQPSMWDLASAVPVAPVQPHDPASRINDHADANYTMGVTQANLNQHLVPMPPFTQRRIGDTADGVLLYDTGAGTGRCPLRGLWCRLFGKNYTPVQTYSRYKPYTYR